MIHKITIPTYIREIVLSNKRATKYFEFAKKHPTAKKYQSDRYVWKEVQGVKNKRFLVDTQTGLRVVANPKAAGTPRVVPINFNYLYSNAVHSHSLGKIMDGIKEEFIPYVNEIPQIQHYPVKIKYTFYDEMKVKDKYYWDIDNRAALYIKCFNDCLTGAEKKGVKLCKQVLPDDSVAFLTGYSVNYMPVDKAEDRKLVISIHRDKEILKNESFSLELNELKSKIEELNKQLKHL